MWPPTNFDERVLSPQVVGTLGVNSLRNASAPAPQRLRQPIAVASGNLAGRTLSAATRKTDPDIGFGEFGTKTATKPQPTTPVWTAIRQAPPSCANTTG